MVKERKIYIASIGQEIEAAYVHSSCSNAVVLFPSGAGGFKWSDGRRLNPWLDPGGDPWREGRRVYAPAPELFSNQFETLTIVYLPLDT